MRSILTIFDKEVERLYQRIHVPTHLHSNIMNIVMHSKLVELNCIFDSQARYEAIQSLRISLLLCASKQAARYCKVREEMKYHGNGCDGPSYRRGIGSLTP